MGIMHHPMIGRRPDGDPDPFFNWSRQCERRCDEVVRASRWQRLAPPFASFSTGTDATERSRAENLVQIDDRILVDSWTFKSGETWMSEAVGKTIRQGAPARVSRGLSLPELHCEAELPFVIASRFPNGAVAVATQGRTTPGQNWNFTPGDVTVAIGAAGVPSGVFGHYRNLTLRFDGSLGKVRVLAQDVAGQDAEDITPKVIIAGNTLTLPGPLIERVGLSAASNGEISDPGLVLLTRKDWICPRQIFAQETMIRNKSPPPAPAAAKPTCCWNTRSKSLRSRLKRMKRREARPGPPPAA